MLPALMIQQNPQTFTSVTHKQEALKCKEGDQVSKYELQSKVMYIINPQKRTEEQQWRTQEALSVRKRTSLLCVNFKLRQCMYLLIYKGQITTMICTSQLCLSSHSLASKTHRSDINKITSDLNEVAIHHSIKALPSSEIRNSQKAFGFSNWTTSV